MNRYDRVKYAKCPLKEVTYQINFPTILSIDANDPIDYQNKLRGDYPIYIPQTQHESQFAFNVEDNTPTPFFQKKQSKKRYCFISKDEKTRIALTNNSISFSTLNYDRWEDMQDKITFPFEEFFKIYEPAFFERIGLRYIDVFNMKELGIDGKDWGDLFPPHICGCLGYKSQFGTKVHNSILEAELFLNDICIRVSSGLGVLDQQNEQLSRESFVLNCDYYILGKFSREEISNTAQKIHSCAQSFFRDSITDFLYTAMQPSPMG